MVSVALLILADESEHIGKLVVVVIGLIFWGISALSAATKNAKEKARKDAMKPRPAQRPPESAPVLPAVQVARRSAAESKRFTTTAARLQQVARKAPVAAVRPAPPPLPPASTQSPEKRPAPATNVAPPTVPARAIATTQPRTGGANAGSLRRWLRPGTMRKQFILTELLQPPKALREKNGFN